MIYSNELVDLEDGLRLFIPTEALIKPTYEYLLKNNPVTPFPFWAKIWPASKAMSAFLQSAPEWIANKRVLEIGAGVGIPSFIIAKQTSEIIISDYSLDAVALIEKNIKWQAIN